MEFLHPIEALCYFLFPLAFPWNGISLDGIADGFFPFSAADLHLNLKRRQKVCNTHTIAAEKIVLKG